MLDMLSQFNLVDLGNILNIAFSHNDAEIIDMIQNTLPKLYPEFAGHPKETEMRTFRDNIRVSFAL